MHKADPGSHGEALLSMVSRLTRRIRHNRYWILDRVPVPSAAWVHQQVYLNPYPKELMLRNHM
jgi:hypothetical protein